MVFLQTEFDERCGQFSPDGRWVAYQSNESGRTEVYVRPFPGQGAQWQISTAGGSWPRWKSDGQELYYLSPDSQMMAARIQVNGRTLEPSNPIALFPTRINLAGVRPQYDVARDGRFLINVTGEDAAPSPITLLLNWHPPSN